MEYHKQFDAWNIRKKATDKAQVRSPYFKERDIWWLSVGVNIGFEEDGKHASFVRPVLIVRKFSKDLFIGLPMSKKLKQNKYYFEVTMKGERVAVLMSQLRVFSSKRIANKLGELDETDFVRVVEYLRGVILPPPKRGRG